MTNQPEALRLAELIDNDLKNSAHHVEAAAELRRLHALLIDQQGKIYGLNFARETERKTLDLVKAERDALRAENERLRQIVADYPPIEAELREVADSLFRAEAERDALRAALKFIADHDLRGTDLTVAGHIAHALIGKARAALKEAK